MSNPIPGPIPLATSTQQGQVSIATQSFGGVKSFVNGAVTNVHDIRLYGAISAANPNNRSLALVDCAPAIRAAIAAWTQTGTGAIFQDQYSTGGIYIPEGNWYIGSPIQIPVGCELYGDSMLLSNILVGPGTPSTPTLVQGFAGPAIAPTGINVAASAGAGLPTYVAPLIGSGRALQLQPYNQLQPQYLPPSFILDDCYAWSGFLQWYAAQLCLRFFCQITTAPPNNFQQQTLIGCYGYEETSAIRVGVLSPDGTHVTFVATLTTAGSGLQTIVSGNFNLSTTHFIEIDYNGSFFDFYVDGVNQGHLAATGRVQKYAWETASLGDEGIESTGLESFNQPYGIIDSIELANIARHTGTGSYIPPAVRLTADANTLWLCNFDQGDPPAGEPWIYAQTVVNTGNLLFNGIPPSINAAIATPPPLGGLNTHYMRLSGWATSVMDYYGPSAVRIHDLAIYCGGSTSGIVCYSAPFGEYNRVLINNATRWGFLLSDGFSFYTRVNDLQVYGAYGTGICSIAEETKASLISGCGISVWGLGGNIEGNYDGGGAFGFINFLIDAEGLFSNVLLTQNNVDEEAVFNYQKCALYVNSATGGLTAKGNIWPTNGSTIAKYTAIYNILPPGGIDHKTDYFFPAPGQTAILSTVGGILPPGPIELHNCANPSYPLVPWTDIQGLLAIRTPNQQGGLQSLSTTNVLGTNLSGTVYVLHGYTKGVYYFPTPEPDANYQLKLTLKNSFGSGPAAGSTTIIGYQTYYDHFVVMVGADPAGTCQLEIGWELLRTAGEPLAYEYLPSIPSTLTNPLAVSAYSTGNWAIGVTFVQASGNVFLYNLTQAEQVAAEMGASPTNFWQLGIKYGISITALASTLGNATQDSFVNNGKLYGLANPGVHNVAMGVSVDPTIGVGIPTFNVYVDGCRGLYNVANQPPPYAGTQQTPITIGETHTSTDALTVATLRNLKVDLTPARVITTEPDAGPQAGTSAQAAYFGDEWTLGSNAGDNTARGGFASQIAGAEYPTTYNWLAAKNGATMVGDILPTFWQGWGGQASLGLAGICLFAGLNDIIAGASAASIEPAITQMLTGVKATGTFIPPIQNTQAWAGWVPPFRGGPQTPTDTATCVIDAVSFTYTCTGTGTILTDLATLAAAINANGTVNALGTASVSNPTNPLSAFLYFGASAPGVSGDGISTSTNGNFGAYWYPGPATSFGNNGSLTIQGVTFQAFFDTDADTTVNDLITLINASAPTLALITPTLVNHQLLLTAVSAGIVGNAVAISANGQEGCSIENGATTLLGGINGAVQNGIPKIVVCTVPPFGTYSGYSAPKETQRNLLNTFIRAITGAGVTIADVDVTLRDPAAHQNMDATYLSADNLHPNDAGHAALYSLISPSMP